VTKTCKNCGEAKRLSEFSCRGRKSIPQDDPRNFISYCKPCQRARSRAHYAENKSCYLFRNRQVWGKKQKLVEELKTEPCLDCGVEYPVCAMDFDHRPGEKKVANISEMIRGHYSMKILQEEIEKCDLVCSNCHRIRTWIERSDPKPDDELTCSACGEEFLRNPYRPRNETGDFCSRSCAASRPRGKASHVDGIKCVGCETEFSLPGYTYRYRLKINKRGLFCSRECSSR